MMLMLLLITNVTNKNAVRQCKANKGNCKGKADIYPKAMFITRGLPKTLTLDLHHKEKHRSPLSHHFLAGFISY